MLHHCAGARTHKHSQEDQREPKKVCLAKFHAISASKVTLLSPRCWTRDGCRFHPFRIMPSSLSLISKSFVLYSESPASLLLPPSSCPFLFIAFLPPPPHLLCSCGVLATSLSQLSITGSPLLLHLSDCAVIAPMHFRRLRIVTFYCLPLCHLTASSKINYPSNKTITAEPGAALFASYRAELFCNHGDCKWNDRGRRKGEDGVAPVDPIIRHLWGRTSERYSINATITRPLTSCRLISLSNQGRKCGDTGAIDYRCRGRGAAEGKRGRRRRAQVAGCGYCRPYLSPAGLCLL